MMNLISQQGFLQRRLAVSCSYSILLDSSACTHEDVGETSGETNGIL